VRKTAEITGQDQVLSQLMTWLEDHQKLQCMVIEGPTGSGKSWLVDELEHHPSTREKYLFIKATGDSANTTRPLLPFLSAISRAQRISRVLKGVAVAGAQASPFRTGALASFMVDAVLNWKEKNSASMTPYLTGAERDILTELNTRVGKSKLVLVLDDLQSWDDTSIDLIKLMLGDHLRLAFPFLGETRFLAIVRPETTQQPKNWKSLRPLFGDGLLKLGYCKEKDFKELLSSLGMASTPSDTDCQSLHQVTQGHLRLALDIARLGKTDASVADLRGRAIDLNVMCAELIAKRLEELGESGEALSGLLTRAATIGLTFTKSEIRCLLEGDTPQLSDLMRQACSADLISAEGDAYAFRHDLLRRYFTQSPSGEQEDLHERFSECLRKLRPGQYEARCQHLTLAGDLNGAANFGAHACLALSRDGRLSPDRRLALLENSSRLARFVDLYLEAKCLSDEGRYEEALELLDDIDLTYSGSLLAEKAILAARCSIKLLTHESFQGAVKILDEALSFVDQEQEVWSRIVLSSFVARTYAGDVEGAKRQALVLSRWAEPRQKFDPDAARILHRLKVRADMYLIPESAAVSLKEACAYFGNPYGEEGVRDPVNYFIALTNLSANALMRGSFSEAYSTAAQANYFLQKCRKSGEIGEFPRIDMHLNNLIVAGWKSGQLDLPSCIDAFQRLVEQAPPTNDKSLLRSNLAVLQIVAGDIASSIDTLGELFEFVSARSDYDAYYVYFIGNNLAGGLFASRQTAKARAIWDKLGQVVPGLDSTKLPYQKRHAIQSQCLAHAAYEASADVWETYIAKHTSLPPEGPSWSFIGTGFLLSDLQYWSDD